ncbi:MAG: hypothetical protein ACJAYC_000968 [Halieaceae bacterium]|jgi:hypothetical protein
MRYKYLIFYSSDSYTGGAVSQAHPQLSDQSKYYAEQFGLLGFLSTKIY